MSDAYQEQNNQVPTSNPIQLTRNHETEMERAETQETNDLKNGAANCAGIIDSERNDNEDGFKSAFGLGPFKCLSSLVTINLFALVLCATVFFESFCTNGINPTNYQSLETRYSFSSKTSGVISIMYDVAYCIIAVPFSYLGTKYLSKPTWLAFGFTIVSSACLVMVLPQFISGQYHVASQGDLTTCDLNRSDLYCDVIEENEDESLLYPVLFSVGNFLFGSGTVAQNTLAVHYFEENSGNSGFYYGLMQASRSIGSILGAGLNAVFLTIPVDLDDLAVDSSHVLWVGAWWIGLCVGGIGVLSLVPVILAFPAKYDSRYTRYKVSNGRVQSLSSSSQLSPPSLPMTATVSEPDTFKVQLKSILTNVPWILFTLAAVPEAFVYSGLVTFGAKFFQLSLGMTSSEAAVTFASVIVLGTLGSIVGALVSRKMSSLRGIIKTLMAVTVLEMILSSSVLLNCPERTILNSPLEVDNGDSKTNNRDNGLCYDNCQCSPSLFQPVCAESSKETYFSACYAGCMNEMQDCRCVGNESDWNHANRKVVDGFCEVDCTQKYLAAIGLGCFCFAMLIKVPIGLSGNLKLLASPDLASMSLAMSNIAFR
ncbi:solute carrier organic anion transporter family member 4A1-like isoform X1 [Convolutriloba macropyga]